MHTVTPNRVAFVTGANGITGAALVNQFASEPDWKKIIAVSRRPGHSLPSDPRVQFISIDLSKSPEEIGQILLTNGATDITHVYHTAYVEGKAEGDAQFQELWDLNVPMFENVLTAVERVSEETLKRVTLQTGGKHYGIFQKAPPVPISEEVGRFEGGPPNFYYGQEDVLFNHRHGKHWSYTVVRPQIIIGKTKGNGMSFTTSLGLYFTIKKYLRQPAVYGGSPSVWDVPVECSTASNIAKFTSYISQNTEAAGHEFNISDADPTQPTFKDYFEYLGQYFGVPIEQKEGYSIAEDMKDKEAVWNEIAEKYGADKEAFGYATWKFLDMTFQGTPGAVVYDMSKARKYGWNETRNTREEIGKVLDEMKKEHIIPHLPTFRA